jgi:AbrB family looped-hinge helix DNA binding protein
MGIELKVAANGRVVIPLDVRRAMGLENGGSVWLEQGDDALELQTRLQKVRRAQKMARKMLGNYQGSLADELIAERRAEAERESRDI